MSELTPLVLGDALLPISFNDCGCCGGLDQETPIALFNRPELVAIGYRVGTHARFMESMLARLSSPNFPALADLRTRDQDDFTIALLNGWATISDILTFYQERIANESYLRTATERRSIIELAKSIGYRPHHGASASTYVAFFLAEAAGAPEQAIKQTKIPLGTRAQSVPGPGELPQTFETVEDIDARLEWNVFKPRVTQPQVLTKQSTDAYLKGTDTGLKRGDAILFVGKARETNSLSDAWDLRFVSVVEPDHANGRTRIEWLTNDEAAELQSVTEAGNPKLYALRLRTSLFGHNAMDPRLLHESIRGQFGLPKLPSDADSTDSIVLETNGVAPATDWDFKIRAQTLDLDNVYPTLLAKSWLVLSKPQPPRMDLYHVRKVAEGSRTDYGLSAKATSATLDTTQNLAQFEGLSYRSTAVYTGSEALELADAPLVDAVSGDEIILDRRVSGLEPDHRLIIRGRVSPFPLPTFFLALPATPVPSPSAAGVLTTLETAALVAPPPASLHPETLAANVATGGDGGGGPTSSESVVKESQTQTEIVTLKEVDVQDGLTTLVFDKPLVHTYERASLQIFANVAAADHGETVNEILGSGDASRPHQRFTLKQKPLTYVGATNARGAESTLEVRIHDILWKEAPTLYGPGPRDRVYTTEVDDEGKVTVLFGDGVNGARLPTGQNNVRATYRKGIGLDGEVAADQISLLMSRPLGVQSVVNPIPATGAADPESRDDARTNAPVTVLTLDRVVSLQDYEDFARSFAGVAKALATWSWDGVRRRVCITVAGPAGATIEEGGTLHNNLVSALRAAGDPFVDFSIKSFRPVAFLLKLKVKVHSDYLPDKVLAQVEQGLRTALGFATRALGQPVHLSEVIAIIEQVMGVEAVDVDRLYRERAPNATPMLFSRLPAEKPILGSDGTIKGAELLTLHTGPLDGLELMP